MTQKFTTPCFIRKNTKKLRNKLKKLGYKPSLSVNIKEPYLWTNKDGTYFSSRNHLSQEKGECITLYGIFCKDDEDLFLALAALREDNDYMQWFTNGTEFILCYRYYWIDMYSVLCSGLSNAKDRMKELDKFHKATAEELIEHFKI